MKCPAFQFYPSDWMKDIELQMTDTVVKGVWIQILCCMWEAPERGKLEGTEEKLASLVRVSQAEFHQFAAAAQSTNFCDYVNHENGIITVINRRMYRIAKEQENNRLMQQRHYAKKQHSAQPNAAPNEKLTGHSSTSSSNTIQIHSLFDFWNEQKIIVHKTMNGSESALKAKLKDYTEEEIKQAITNYAKVLDGTEYFFKYRWTLKDFLNRGLEKFLQAARPLDNFRVNKPIADKVKRPYDSFDKDKFLKE